MASLINYVQEQNRQAVTGDRNFLRQFLCYFELRVPAEAVPAGVSSEFLFPIALPPESCDMGEPFAVEVTKTLDGGLYLEENGIVDRMLRIRGHTGWAPRFAIKSGLGSLDLVSPDKRNWGRSLMARVVDKLSGQKHLQYLQDAVFRTYGALKADPATAKGTFLLFHAPKDGESWLVSPKSFDLSQSKGDPLYHYDIALLVLGPADAANLVEETEDLPLLGVIQDRLTSARMAIDLMGGALTDLTAMQADITRLSSRIPTLLDGCTTVMGAAQDFLDGTTDLIQVPATMAGSMTALAEATVLAVLQARSVETDLQVGFLAHAINTLAFGASLLAAHPESFETSTDARLRNQRALENSLTSSSAITLAEAEAAEAPATLSDVEYLGTSLTPGAVAEARGTSPLQRGLASYSGVREHQVAQGDTLANLAARYLGDGRLWKHIAVLNGLRPPFIDEQATAAPVSRQTDDTLLDGVLGVGERILIPLRRRTGGQDGTPHILGTPASESLAVRFLGRDLALEQDSSGLFDVPVNTDNGSTDVRTVEGVANLEQALLMIVRTDRGSLTLYRKVGIRKIVGVGLTPLDLDMMQFRVSEALLSDPRIVAVREIQVLRPEGTGDQLQIETKCEVRGFTEPLRLGTRLGV